jgi:hypothetical protein
MVNTFKQPNWGDGDIDAEDIAQFMDFMEYLIPIEEERTYFLDWLACKAQNLGFRGAAILMIAQSQGTGRTTLSDMLATLFSRVNTAHVPFPQLCKTDGQFNEWQEKPLVFTDETLSLGGESYYKVYETLKEIFDPRPKETWINPKYGRKRVVMCHSSYLMFSNHTNALATAVDDRRIYVIENAPVPWPGEKFAELNAWLDEKDADGKPYWAKAVWRWLQAREVDPNEMTKPAPKTAQKIAMSESSASPIEVVVRSVLNNYPLPVVNPFDIKTVCARVGHRINYTADSHSNGIVNRILRDMTRKTHESLKIRVGAKIVRPKLIVNNQLQSNTQIYGVADIGYTARGNLAAELKRVDIDELVTQAEEALDLMDL